MSASASHVSQRQETPSAPNPRRVARELVVQGLYSWLANRDEAGVVDAFMRQAPEFDQADREHYGAVLHGTIAQSSQLDALLAKHIDRPMVQVSMVEHAVLLIAVYELRALPHIPYRVIINEAIELTKDFGGTDGYKFVNGVLDRLAPELRPDEAKAVAAARRRPR